MFTRASAEQGSFRAERKRSPFSTIRFQVIEQSIEQSIWYIFSTLSKMHCGTSNHVHLPCHIQSHKH